MAVGMAVRGVPVTVRRVEDEAEMLEDSPDEVTGPGAVVEPRMADEVDKPVAPGTVALEPSALEPVVLEPDASAEDANLDALTVVGSAVEESKPLLVKVGTPNPVEELAAVERVELPAKVEGDTWLIGVTTGRAVVVPWRGSVMALWRDWVELTGVVDGKACELADDKVGKLASDEACELTGLETGLAAVELPTPVGSKVEEQTDSVSVSTGACVEFGRLMGSALVEPAESELATATAVDVERTGMPVGTTVPVAWPFAVEELLSLVDAGRIDELMPVPTGACRGALAAGPGPQDPERFRRGPASAAAKSARACSINVVCILESWWRWWYTRCRDRCRTKKERSSRRLRRASPRRKDGRSRSPGMESGQAGCWRE